MNTLPNLPSPSNSGLEQPEHDFARTAPVSAEGAPESGGPSMARMISAVLGRKWIILLVTVLGTGGGIVASRFVDPLYEAQSTMWVEIGGEAADRGPIRTGELLQSTAWVELLKSYTVLDHAVQTQHLFIETAEELNLFSSFELGERFRPGKYRLQIDKAGTGFSLQTAEGQVVEEGSVASAIGEPAGFTWLLPAGEARPDRRIDFTLNNPRDVAARLRTELVTAMAEENGNFLRVTLAGPNRWRIALTLNAIADRYVQVAAELKRAKLDELTAILDEQRRFAEENLRTAEINLESFRVSTVTLPTDRATPVAPGLEATRDPVFEGFFEMKTSREQLRQDREAIARVLEEMRSEALSVDALAAVPAVREAPALLQTLQEHTNKLAELRALQQRYTNDHPPVRRLLQDVENLQQRVIPRMAVDLQRQIADQEAELDGRIASASGELQAIPPRMTEEARLQRQVAIAENLHSTLKQRYEEARLAAASSIPDVRVLDRAIVPYEPVSDSRILFILMGLLGGLGLSVAGAILHDRIDPRVRYPEQVTGELGLQILASVPNVAEGSAQLTEENSAHASEAFRELRLNLQYAHGNAGPVMVTITSPESGDGKSFITANLAIAFAEQGYRTLIIDGDIRRGRLHRLLGVERVPGLTDYLAGSASLEEVLQPTQFAGVSLITAGTRMPNGPELLGSSSMGELIMGLRSRFDTILVDSAPLGAGVDPYVLGTITRNLLLVLRTGSTNRTFAGAKIDLLDRLPIRLLGVALNGVPQSKLYRSYSYLPGYKIESEAVASSATS